MEQLIELHGNPAALRLDNGMELTSHAIVDWAKERNIALRFSEPGKPNQNAYIERFNRTYRDEVLDCYLFDSIEQVQDITDRWLPLNNEQRPHDSLGRVPPLTYLPRELTARECPSASYAEISDMPLVTAGEDQDRSTTTPAFGQTGSPATYLRGYLH